MTHAGTISTAVLAVALACACRSHGGAGPVDASLPALQRSDGWAVVCIVDARSGRPIAGATFAAVPESDAPLPGTWWQAHASESDADGIARLELSGLAEDPWLLVRADGYAPHMVLARDPGPRVALEPAVDLEIEVRDAFERPVEGAFVSWYAGCGHTPDLVWGTTDARGRARLAGVAADPSAGDLWIAGPRLATGTASVPVAGPVLARVGPGVAARGLVVDEQGQPLAGVYVGVPVGHHGPWTATDRDGAFELPGIEPRFQVQVLADPDAQSWLGAFEVPEDGRALTLRVPLDREPVTTALALRLRARGALESPAGIHIECVRGSDGLTVRARGDEDGKVALELPAGEWTVRAGGGFSGWNVAQSSFSVADAPLELTLELEAQARWRFRLAQPHPEARLELVGEHAVHELAPGEFEGASAPLPREGDCAVRVVLHDRVRVVPIDAVARRQAGELELELPAPLDLRARLLDHDGRPQRGALWIGRGEPPEGSEGLVADAEMPRARSWRAEVDLWVLPAEPSFAPRRLARALPWDATRLDLGAVVLDPAGARRVTLQGSDGAPLAGAVVHHFARLGRHVPDLGADGSFESAAFPAVSGDALAVRPADGGPTFHATLTGAGPWTVSRPDTRVAFEVVGVDGLALERFRVVVEGEVFEGAGGRLELVGLDPGAHTAFVTADGHGAWRQPLEVGSGAPLDVRVVLPER